NPAFGFATWERAKVPVPPGLPDPIRDIRKGLPPALILIGSKDEFFPACQEFCAKGKELGSRVEIEAYEGQPHAFFNNAPWMEKTILRADEFLKSLGYLAEEPKVTPPTGAPQATPGGAPPAKGQGKAATGNAGRR
ncbi:MAG: alpha/beta hydrolase, partial [Planctomycetes bacterium]|nr:alpha/beta hydrolase [Planctomycetota bacterium]